MTLRKKSYYNILVSKYGNDDGKVVESRWMVTVDSLPSWLRSVDLSRCEVLIRDIEVIGFDCLTSPPLWFRYGD